MSRWWVRVGLVIVMLAMAVASGYQVFLAERQINDGREAERAFTALAWKYSVSLSDLRGAQQAYVAAGQNRVYWVDKVASHLDAITTNLGSLSRLATVSGTMRALDDATAAVDDLRRMDALAREQTAAGQELIASDLIFTDGLELAQRAASHVEFARTTERLARDEKRQQRRNAQAMMLAAAMTTGLLVSLLLLPGSRSTQAAEKRTVSDAAATVGSTESSVKAGRLLFDIELDTDRLSIAEPEPDELPLSEPAPAMPNLRHAADLCTDFGRLSNTEELPALLERAAALLNATGIIVWVSNISKRSLRPAVAHGYTARALSLMGNISSDGDNATAAAFRSVQTQVVTGIETSGAIAVPLISSTTCVGVMSAEIQEGWETSDAVQATASIVAAQLATLLDADPDEVHGENIRKRGT